MLARCQMLYERWTEIRDERRDQLALRHPDVTGGWTFGQLQAEAEKIDLPASGPVIANGDSAGFIPTVIAAWAQRRPVLIQEQQKQEPLPIRAEIPDDIALIKQSCGASGVERSLFYGETRLLAEGMRNIHALEQLGVTSDCRSLGAISLAHSYGFGCLVLPLLLAGIPLDVLSGPLPMFVQQGLDRGPEKSFFLPGVPALWKTWWLTKILAHPSIKVALSAGAPLSLELEQGVWNDAGLKIHNFYGTGETGAVTCDFTSEPRGEASLIGTMLPGVDVMTAEDGRICVRTDATARFADKLLGSDEFSEDYYRTMDLGEVRGKEVHWHDHCGEAINVAGRKVSPAKIARACMSLTGVLEAKVSSVRSRDFERFEEVKIAVRLAPGCDLKQLKQHASEQLDSWEVPRHWEVLDSTQP
ncbi:AMP-binding protein [Verrucomicrobiaceae bacterium 5K15]|uniref:AMP-binding protein n=1 Tax=Oceaniferula flava TaxID=2800421 RepID=A0AAE2SDD9_9BACT|nr:AMP-binding protein [Oceaniferula flavus]MBK1854927.1 AMP-binding protein [Oceaniferula flavus]MBM1136233.1 AMP-binding protein [Oceaniferula flavus]